MELIHRIAKRWEQVETVTFGDVAAKWLEMNKSGHGESWLADVTQSIEARSGTGNSCR